MQRRKLILTIKTKKLTRYLQYYNSDIENLFITTTFGPLAFINNNSIELVEFLTSLKQYAIFFIFKGGDRSGVVNYHPYSYYNIFLKNNRKIVQ